MRRLNTRSFATFVSATALTIAAGAVSAETVSQNKVVIGVLTDMTGGFSDLGGQGSVDAAAMAVEDFKNSVKPAFTIELVFGDHQNKADIGSALARRWYDVEGVDAVFDLTNSAVALAVSDITREKDRVMIATGGGTTRLTNEDCSPNTISYAWDTYSYAAGLAGKLTEQGNDSWYIINVDYTLGQALAQDASNAIKANGGEVLGQVAHPLGASDFASFILQAQASGAKAIGIASPGADMHNILKTAMSFGLSSEHLLAPFVATTTDVRALGLEVMQGVHMIDAFYNQLNDDTRQWSQRYHEKYNRVPNFVHASTYSAVQNYLRAVEGTGSDDASVVMDHLKSTVIEDMFTQNGHIRPDGRMIHDLYLVKVKSPEESSGEDDLVELVSVIPGDVAFEPLSASRCELVSRN